MNINEHNRKIIVIDDNSAIHDDFRKILQTSKEKQELDSLNEMAANLFGEAPASPSAHVDFEIDSAYQGQEGLDLIKKSLIERSPYSLAFVDGRMPPGLNGIETIEKIWEEDPEIQVVLCTAYSDYSWDDIVNRLGVNDQLLILKKPFDATEILQLANTLTMKWSLAQNSKTDSLTNISNRRAFYDHLRHELDRSRRYMTPLSCVMFDVDFFKRINDTFGHIVGDEALKNIADILKRTSRSIDIVSRLGGDEFCALLPETSENSAFLWAEKIRKAISDIRMSVDGTVLKISSSFGVSSEVGPELSPADFIEQADQALLKAKQLGRDRVELYSNTQDESDPNHKDGFQHLLNDVKASDIMTAAVMVVRDAGTVDEAAELFLTLRINSAPVVDKDGYLVGIVSEKDVMLSQLANLPWKSTIRDLMKKNVITYDEDVPAKVIYDFLCRATIRRVVIVKDGKPTGVISRGTILRWFDSCGDAQCETENDQIDSSNDKKYTTRVHDTIKLLSHLAITIEKDLTNPDEIEIIPQIISTATKMQEHIAELLACSATYQAELLSNNPSPTRPIDC